MKDSGEKISLNLNNLVRDTLKLKTFLLVIATTAVFSWARPADAGQSVTLIEPIGYSVINGKVDKSHSLPSDHLQMKPQVFKTEPSLGTHWELERVIGFDSRRLVADTTKAPFRWVGKIEYMTDTGAPGKCTGALVGPDTVITAGHCLINAGFGITFSPGINGELKPFSTVEAKEIWVDRNYGSTGNDWGVIKTDRPIGNEVGWFGFSAFNDRNLDGQFATVIGYPNDKTENTMWMDRNKVIGFSESEVHYLADTFSGQSGAPVVDNKATLYAIHRGGTLKKNSGPRISENLFTIIYNLSLQDSFALG